MNINKCTRIFIFKFLFLFSLQVIVLQFLGSFSKAYAMPTEVPEVGLASQVRIRPVPNSKNLPWRIHGQIVSTFNGHDSFGTGFLIDRQHVLTAAHNIFWPSGFNDNREPLRATKILFYPGSDANDSTSHQNILENKIIYWETKATKVAFPTQWRDTLNYEEVKHYDYGLLRLENPLEVGFGYCLLHLEENPNILIGKSASVTGYPVPTIHHNNIIPGKMYTLEGTIVDLLEIRNLRHNIDTYSGNSGSGVLFPNADGRVVGVHNYGWISTNRATHISPDVHRDVEEWKKNMEAQLSASSQPIEISEDNMNVDEEVNKIEEKIKALTKKKEEIMQKKLAENLKKRKQESTSKVKSPKRVRHVRKKKEQHNK